MCNFYRMTRAFCVAGLLLSSGGCEEADPLRDARKRYLLLLELDASASELCAEAKRNVRYAADKLNRNELSFWIGVEKKACDLPSG